MKKISFFMMLYFCFPLIVFAETISVTTIINKINENLTRVKDFKAFYTEYKEVNFSNNFIESEAGFIYKKSNLIRKNVQKPASKTIIITPSFYYEKDLKTYEEKRIDLSTDKKLDLPRIDQSFTIADFLKKYQFVLKNPDDKSNYYYLKTTSNNEDVTLKVNKSNFTIEELQINYQKMFSFTVKNQYELITNIPVINNIEIIGNVKANNYNYKIKYLINYKNISINNNLSDDLFEI